jgi:hypothetical protein
VQFESSRIEFFTTFLPTPSTGPRLKSFLTRVQIGVIVVAVVKTERLALTVIVVTLCQCREMDVKDFSATKTVELIQKD